MFSLRILPSAVSRPSRRLFSTSVARRQALDVPLWIGGRDVKGGSSFEVRHPKSGEVVSSVSTASKADVCVSRPRSTALGSRLTGVVFICATEMLRSLRLGVPLGPGRRHRLLNDGLSSTESSSFWRRGRRSSQRPTSVRRASEAWSRRSTSSTPWVTSQRQQLCASFLPLPCRPWSPMTDPASVSLAGVLRLRETFPRPTMALWLSF